MTTPLDPRTEAAAKAAYEGARAEGDTAWEDIAPADQEAWRATVRPVLAAADAVRASMTEHPRGNRGQRGR